MQTTNATDRGTREEKVTALFQRLQNSQQEEFRAAIAQEADDDLLADLRYHFGYDTDPNKSAWQTREINRLLTKRKYRRESVPKWIAIIISGLLSVASLIVSILSLLKKPGQ